MKLGELHKLSVVPTDFAERNVVCRSGSKDYRLIDFQDIKYGHECSWTGRFYEGGPQPDFSKIDCRELFNNGHDMRIWGLRKCFTR